MTSPLLIQWRLARVRILDMATVLQASSVYPVRDHGAEVVKLELPDGSGRAARPM